MLAAGAVAVVVSGTELLPPALKPVVPKPAAELARSVESLQRQVQAPYAEAKRVVEAGAKVVETGAEAVAQEAAKV